MRICSPQLGVAPCATLGGEVYDREVLMHLAALGAAVEVILPAGLPHPPMAPWQVSRAPLRRGYRWFVSNPVFLPEIGKAFRRRPFDLLRVHSLRFTGPAAVAARRLYRLRVPIVAHHHHVEHDGWTRLVDRRVARSVDLVITGSRHAREQLLRAFDLPEEKVAVVPYGVGDRFRPTTCDPAFRSRLLPDGGELLVHVGSLIPRKNLLFLLEVVRRVREVRRSARLVLAGRGPQEAALRKRAGELGLGSAVHFAGAVDEREKLACYAASALYVAPSRMEGFGLAAAEAMACGLPVVASDAGALPELVRDGETGLLASPRDADAFAAAVLRLLEDPRLARRLGDAGRERVDRSFRWPLAAGRTLELYRRLL